MVVGYSGTPTQPTYYVATTSNPGTPVQSSSPAVVFQTGTVVPPPMALPVVATHVPAPQPATNATAHTVCVLHPTQPATGTCVTVQHAANCACATCKPACACAECVAKNACKCAECEAKRRPTCQCADCRKKAEEALRDKAKRDEAERWVSRIRKFPLNLLKGLTGPEMQDQIDKAVEEVQLRPQALTRSALCAVHNNAHYAAGPACTPQVRHNRHTAEVFVSNVLGIPLYVAQGIGATQLQVLCDAAMTSMHHHFG